MKWYNRDHTLGHVYNSNHQILQVNHENSYTIILASSNGFHHVFSRGWLVFYPTENCCETKQHHCGICPKTWDTTKNHQPENHIYSHPIHIQSISYTSNLDHSNFKSCNLQHLKISSKLYIQLPPFKKNNNPHETGLLLVLWGFSLSEKLCVVSAQPLTPVWPLTVDRFNASRAGPPEIRKGSQPFILVAKLGGLLRRLLLLLL